MASAAVVVRLHAVAGPAGVAVMPGGNGRVLAPGDDPRDPRAHRAKDVWVVGAHAALPLIVAPQLPQVDLASSVPTRAADALFWMGRSAERAEAIARTVRVVAGRRRQDPGLVVAGGGRWGDRMVGVLRAVRRAPSDGRDDRGDGADGADLRPPGPFGLLDDELAASTAALVVRLREFVAQSASVGEYLSSSTARSLNALVHLLETIGEGAPPIDAIDDVMSALAAFMGMWNESTVRGPAWRFGDIGLRLERALVVLELLVACLAPAIADGGGGGEPDAAALEVLLAANESLVAYRRQYRSDIELAPTLALLVGDRDNPRGYLSCLDRIAEHAADVEWDEGVERIGALAASLLAAAPGGEASDVEPVIERAAAAHDGVEALAEALVAAWFATPVRPTVVMAGGR